jgi:exopolyphosphatase / guanosine-5'-triphosphate,3'-diphosphate pyrophosphatase
MRASVLDLGSNSFHLLVADLEAGRVTPVLRRAEMLHLGAIVARHGEVPVDARGRAIASVSRLTGIARRAGAIDHHVVATSALREAANSAEVLASLGGAAGSEVRVLDGTEEARLGYLGVRAAGALPPGPALVLDLGGGSLELTVGVGDEVRWSTSLPLGGSRLSTLVAEDPPTRHDLEQLSARIDEHLLPVLPVLADQHSRTTVAVGGSVRVMARIAAEAGRVETPISVHRLHVSVAELATLRDRLLALDQDGRWELLGVDSGRANHLHVAAVALTRVLERLGIVTITVSAWGLREGLLLDTTIGRTADTLGRPDGPAVHA